MSGNLSLEQRYLAVMARIGQAAQAAGRDPDSVRLLAVSKTFAAGSIRELAAVGQMAFGENYLQEALGKIAALGHLRPDVLETQARESLEWHFIGPIQSNKTRKIAESFDWVQSVYDLRIAQRLSDQRPYHLPPLNICLQVNVSGEASKSGCRPEEVVALAKEVGSLPNLRLRGLMAIPEATDDAALQASRFSQVRELFDAVRSACFRSATSEPVASQADSLNSFTSSTSATPDTLGAFDTLSMGMSADLEAAIAQGATLVRVGAALFGERPQPP